MVNLAPTPKEKVEVLCKRTLAKPLNLLFHQQGGCFGPRGPRKVHQFQMNWSSVP